MKGKLQTRRENILYPYGCLICQDKNKKPKQNKKLWHTGKGIIKGGASQKAERILGQTQAQENHPGKM